jgi:hypothetical protein
VEMAKNLIDRRALRVVGVPAPDKELPELFRYAQVLGVGRYCRAFTLNDLVRNLRVPERVERYRSGQYL